VLYTKDVSLQALSRDPRVSSSTEEAIFPLAQATSDCRFLGISALVGHKAPWEVSDLKDNGFADLLDSY
jgi:hypothetical protein